MAIKYDKTTEKKQFLRKTRKKKPNNNNKQTNKEKVKQKMTHLNSDTYLYWHKYNMKKQKMWTYLILDQTNKKRQTNKQTKTHLNTDTSLYYHKH